MKTPISLTDRLRIGSGVDVSPVVLGMTDSWKVVGAAFDAGINSFFLTADMHWPLYEQLRKGLKDLLKRKHLRDQISVFATAYVTQPDFCHAPFEEVLEAIPGLGSIDVLCAGGVYASDFPGRWPVYQQHRTARFAGCRAVGASFHDRKTAREALSASLVDLAFVRFNAGHPGAIKEILEPLPARKRRAIYSFKSMTAWVPAERLYSLGLDTDQWVPAPVDHYRFALSTPGIAGVLASLDRPAEIKLLADALSTGPMSASERAYMIRLSQADAQSP